MKFDFRLSGKDLLEAERLAFKRKKSSVGLLAKDLLLKEILKEGK